MKTAFITIGTLLFLWGLASLIFAVQDAAGGVSARPRQEIAYAAAFLISGGVLAAAGMRTYAINRMLVLGVVFLHAAVYSGGALMESMYRDEAAGTAAAVSSALFAGAIVSLQRAHRLHAKAG